MDLNFLKINWQEFNFEHPSLLAIAFIFILFLVFEYFPGRNYFYSLQGLKKFIDKHLITHLIHGSETRRKSWLRTMIISLIWVLLTLALANPRWDYQNIETSKPNINLVILLDISKSMDAKDEKPSRLERAKQEIVDILKKSEGINVGLIAFANQAHIISPVTDDKNAIKYLLSSINTNLVGVQGSNIKAGVKSSELLLKAMEGGYNYILVMSDGGFDDEIDLKSLSQSVKNTKIITFGFGGTEGAPIPDENGKFIKEGDKTVITKLEKDKLISLSGLDNYIQPSYLDDDTDKLIKILNLSFKATNQKAKLYRIWHDRFYIPLGAAMLILLFFFRKGAIFPAIILTFSFNSYAQHQTDQDKIIDQAKNILQEKSNLENIGNILLKNSDQQAKDFYEDGQFKQAEEKFTSPYNKGIAAFRHGDYENAENYFAAEKDINIDAEYNLGNAQLLGQKVKEAIDTYESVLKKAPSNEDAKHNLEIAKKLLKNQQKQNQNQNKDKDKDQQNKNDQTKNNSSQQNKQDQQNGDNDKNNPKNNDSKSAEKNQQNGGSDNEQQQSQDNDGKMKEKELDIQAKSILSKISSDPEKLMKNRFQYEESKEGNSVSGTYNSPKPW